MAFLTAELVDQMGFRQMWLGLSLGRLANGLRLGLLPFWLEMRKTRNDALVNGTGRMFLSWLNPRRLTNWLISLSSFVQKIWEKWLSNYIKTAVEARLIPQQHGFRTGYQSPELVQMLLGLKEVAGEWGGSYVFLKVDIRKAFDRVTHSSLLISLLRLETDRRCVEAIAEEILFAKIRPRLDAVEAAEEVRLFLGVREGSPLSGLLFILILSDVLRPLEERWGDLFLGCKCGRFRYTHLVFADDFVLIGKDGREIAAMLSDLQQALATVGLETNASKFQYIYGPQDPLMSRTVQGLPGTDQSEKGMEVLGRTIRGGSLPDDVHDLHLKKAKGWGRPRFSSCCAPCCVSETTRTTP